LLVNQLYAHTAGTATKRPNAEVTSASEIPPATADRPAVFSADMPLKALMMPTVLPNRPPNGAPAPIVARPHKPRFRSRVPSRASVRRSRRLLHARKPDAKPRLVHRQSLWRRCARGIPEDPLRQP